MARLHMVCWDLAELRKIYFPALSFHSEKRYRLQSQRGPATCPGKRGWSRAAAAGGDASGCACAPPALDGNVGLQQLWEGSLGAPLGVGNPKHPSLRIPARLFASLPVFKPPKTSGGLLDKM